jgi:hypothetical protein
MIRKILAASAAAFAFTALAFADDHGPAGQTFEVSAGEVTQTVAFADDGTYTASVGDQSATGTWTFSDDTLCIVNAAGEACGAWSGLAVGESTTSSEFSADGSEATIKRVS